MVSMYGGTVLRYTVDIDRLASALGFSNSLVAGSPTEIGGAVIISKGGGPSWGVWRWGGEFIWAYLQKALMIVLRDQISCFRSISIH